MISACCFPRRRLVSVSSSVYERSRILLQKSDTQTKNDGINMIIYRRYSNSYIIQHEPSTKQHRRVALEYGRARRKRLKAKLSSGADVANQDSQSQSSINDTASSEQTTTHTAGVITTDDDSNNTTSPFTGNILRDRYLRKQRPKKYPKTWAGWKDACCRAWEKYLWTHEGFLREEKKGIKRDDNGNIMQTEEEEDDDDDKNSKSLQDKATNAASDLASNVQKNVHTIKEEVPKLVQIGQQITGVSTKEELREWVGEQLKLGTACLAAFMKGYRKGRDEEVDRMLHEYFKDLDEKTDSEKKDIMNDTTSLDNDVNQDNVKSDDTKQYTRHDKRPWGRKERRRLKSFGGGKGEDGSDT